MSASGYHHQRIISKKGVEREKLLVLFSHEPKSDIF